MGPNILVVSGMGDRLKIMISSMSSFPVILIADLPNVHRSVSRGGEDELLGGVEAQRVDRAGVASVLQHIIIIN